MNRHFSNAVRPLTLDRLKSWKKMLFGKCFFALRLPVVENKKTDVSCLVAILKIETALLVNDFQNVERCQKSLDLMMFFPLFFLNRTQTIFKGGAMTFK